MAEQGVEISNPTLGSIKVFGMSPNTLFTVFTFVTSTAAAVFLYMHIDEAHGSGKEIAQAIQKSNKEMADAIKESQKETSSILREMAKNTREQNCLLAIDQNKRAQMVEFCKRLAQ